MALPSNPVPFRPSFAVKAATYWVSRPMARTLQLLCFMYGEKVEVAQQIMASRAIEDLARIRIDLALFAFRLDALSGIDER